MATERQLKGLVPGEAVQQAWSKHALTPAAQGIDTTSPYPQWGRYPSGHASSSAVEAWLQQYGFQFNPFTVTESERDGKLNGYFVEHLDFEKTTKLEDRIIFAGTGEGKTAIRLRLQTLFRDALAYERVFAFSYLIPSELARNPTPDLAAHLRSSLIAAVRHAFVFFALSGAELPQLRHPGLAQALARYFDAFYGMSTWREDLQDALATFSLHQIIINLSPTYDDLSTSQATGSFNVLWLKTWSDLLTQSDGAAQPSLPITEAEDADYWLETWTNFRELLFKAGIQTIVILSDGVDIKPNVPNNFVRATISAQMPLLHNNGERLERMVAVTQPIVSMMRERLLGDHVFFKIFLPRELFLPLAPALPYQLPIDIIHWDYDRLEQLLAMRLRAATNGAVSTLAQLVEPDVHELLETYLIVGAKASPRTLIHSINGLFWHHINSAPPGLPCGKLSRRSLTSMRHGPYPSP